MDHETWCLACSQIKYASPLGRQMLQRFFDYEVRRKRRRKPARESDNGTNVLMLVEHSPDES